MTKLTNAIAEAKRLYMIEDARSTKDHEAEHKAMLNDAKPWLNNSRPATIEEYGEWLDGRINLSDKHKINYCYGTFPKERYIILTKDSTITPLYGSALYYIIVPAGIKVDAKNIGHSNIYYMDGFETSRGARNIAYDDML